MILFINKITGTEMWVADNRKEQYLAAGHKLAADPIKPTEEPEEQEAKETKKRKR